MRTYLLRPSVVTCGACLALASVPAWGQSASPPPAHLIAPVLHQRVHPVYPPDADGRRVDVELLLTVDATGAVSQVEVLGHVPADVPASFDAAARDAARTLSFTPAQSDGQPTAVRLRFHMAIVPPTVTAASQAPSESTGPPEAPEMGAGAEGIVHSHTDGTLEPPSPGSSSGAPSSAASSSSPEPEGGVRVTGARVEPRAVSDITFNVGPLRQVPITNAMDMMRGAAPGILLTNEGGEGHAEQVYLRGFDAREGQDLEFTVNGVPINEPGNPHGEGLANTHFIIPELVRSIRVIEGPFDPHQGNYAVAGSADYQLGLEQRGLSIGYTYGSFNTHRLLALWGPEDGRIGTFAGADLRTTDGYGVNRAARLARGMGQYEFTLGHTVVQLLATTYATQYSSAGVIREDDFEAGRIGFYGTYDPTQGGDNMRHSVSLHLEDARPERTLRQQVFAILNTMRLRENYTGFVEDLPQMWRSGFAQRGDEVDQQSTAVTVGARGSLRLHSLWHGLQQAIEAGYYGRFDNVDASQRRLQAGTNIPYRIDSDLGQAITNLGMFLDAEVRPLTWVTLRGGVRGDFFGFDVLNRCAVHDASLGSTTPIDTLCYSRDRTGPRDPTSRVSANGLVLQPRGTLMVGPFEGVTFSGSVGSGARSADPSYLADGNQSPFSSILAAEGGAIFSRRWGPTALTLRALYFYTFVNRDLIFNEQEGRNTLAPGTERQGGLLAGRFSGRWFDWNASVTYASARFVHTAMDPGSTYVPPGTGDKVPYVPAWVARSDAAVFGPLPGVDIDGQSVMARAGLGVTYVSPRTLPYNEQGDPIFLVDASVGARWRWIEVGIAALNVLNTRYRLGEYNYVSEFNGSTPTPNLVAARTFTAGAPLSVFATLTLYFGGNANTLGRR